MLDKLVEFLVSIIRLFQFFAVVPEFAGGVILRLGTFNRIAKRFNWVWPFNIEEVLSTSVVTETMTIGPQSLTTKDGVSVVISIVITFFVSEVKTLLLHIEGAGQVIEDSAYGVVSDFVLKHTWADLIEEDIPGRIVIPIRRKAKKYGVSVETAEIIDFTRSKSYRMMQQWHGHLAAVSHT